MRLLICTQKVDKNDPVLGFFHRWIEVLAKDAEEVTVICLEEGEYTLPKNVRVFSLGKKVSGTFSPQDPKGAARKRFLTPFSQVWKRLCYASLFYKRIWQERKNYDAVFVHMNQEYVLLGGWLWRLLGKKVTMWRNHGAGNWLTDIAATFCHHIFCTSQYSYTARYAKTVLIPVGIDTEMYAPAGEVSRIPHSVLYVGRIAPVKNVHVLLAAALARAAEDPLLTATFIGPDDPRFPAYLPGLQQTVVDAGLSGRIRFLGPLPAAATVPHFQSHQLLVNLSPDGMYDKVIFEAMASGCLVLVSNKQLQAALGATYAVSATDAVLLAKKIAALVAVSPDERTRMSDKLRAYVVAEHSLALLADRLSHIL